MTCGFKQHLSAVRDIESGFKYPPVWNQQRLCAWQRVRVWKNRWNSQTVTVSVIEQNAEGALDELWNWMTKDSLEMEKRVDWGGNGRQGGLPLDLSQIMWPNEKHALMATCSGGRLGAIYGAAFRWWHWHTGLWKVQGEWTVGFEVQRRLYNWMPKQPDLEKSRWLLT